MKRTISAIVFATSLLVPTMLGQEAFVFAQEKEEPVVTLAVTPGFDYAPAKASYKVTIPPHKDNFWICWGFFSTDSAIYARKSCEQLHGIYSAKVLWFEYKDLPEGNYEAWVDVYRVPNRLAGKAQAKFRVLPPLGG